MKKVVFVFTIIMLGLTLAIITRLRSMAREQEERVAHQLEALDQRSARIADAVKTIVARDRLPPEGKEFLLPYTMQNGVADVQATNGLKQPCYYYAGNEVSYLGLDHLGNSLVSGLLYLGGSDEPDECSPPNEILTVSPKRLVAIYERSRRVEADRARARERSRVEEEREQAIRDKHGLPP